MDELLIQIPGPAPSLTQGLAGAKRTQMPAYAYILRCSDGKYYYGSTGDLSRRLVEHREGLCRWTARRRPVELVYFEEHETLAQAGQREHSFKNGRTRRKKLEHMVATFPPEKLAPFA